MQLRVPTCARFENPGAKLESGQNQVVQPEISPCQLVQVGISCAKLGFLAPSWATCGFLNLVYAKLGSEKQVRINPGVTSLSVAWVSEVSHAQYVDFRKFLHAVLILCGIVAPKYKMHSLPALFKLNSALIDGPGINEKVFLRLLLCFCCVSTAGLSAHRGVSGQPKPYLDVLWLERLSVSVCSRCKVHTRWWSVFCCYSITLYIFGLSFAARLFSRLPFVKFYVSWPSETLMSHRSRYNPLEFKVSVERIFW